MKTVFLRHAGKSFIYYNEALNVLHKVTSVKTAV